jgi:hypothetical protein
MIYVGTQNGKTLHTGSDYLYKSFLSALGENIKKTLLGGEIYPPDHCTTQHPSFTGDLAMVVFLPFTYITSIIDLQHRNSSCATLNQAAIRCIATAYMLKMTAMVQNTLLMPCSWSLDPFLEVSLSIPRTRKTREKSERTWGQL